MEFQSEQLGVLVLPVILIAYLGVFFYLIYGFLSYSLLTYLVIGIAAYRTWESFLKIPRKIKPNVKEEYSVTIIGSGFAGVCMGVKLSEAGISYRILEMESDLGGTWYSNKYPGARCDVWTPLYQFSFFQNPAWSCWVAPAQELQDYIRRVVDHFGLTNHIKYNAKVKSATWNEGTKDWTIATDSGEVFKSKFVVSGCGALREPSIPDFPGKDLFKGPSFHSSRWAHSQDLAGKRVALIGSGASAAQIGPEIVDQVKSLHVFQRTPNWFFPKLNPDNPDFLKWIYRNLPFTKHLMRAFMLICTELFALGWLRKGLISRVIQFGAKHMILFFINYDKELAEKVIPDYELGCKRLLFTHEFLPIFLKDNCNLVTNPIKEITEKGIRTKDGVHHKFDVIIYATGFRIEESICGFKVSGRKDTSLREHFDRHPCAHLGISVPSFPNYFILLGPNTVLAHNSVLFMIEWQANYITDAILKMARAGISSIEARKDVTKQFQTQMTDLTQTKNFSGSCRGWYKNKDGINFILWPSNLLRYWWMTKSADLINDYRLSMSSH